MYPKNRDKKTAMLSAYWTQRILLCWLIWWLPKLVLAQSPTVIDSLQAVLKTVSGKPKVDVYNKLAKQHQRIDSLKTQQYISLALKLAQQYNYPKGMVDALVVRGHVAKKRGRYQEASKTFLQIKEIGNQYSYTEAKPLAYKGLGLVEAAQSNYKEALDYYNESLQAYRAIDNRKGVSDIENNIGVIYFKKGEYNQALKYHLKALALRELLKEEQAIAISLNNIGIVYLRQGNYPKALDNYFKSLKIKEKYNNLSGMAASYNNISVIYISQYKYYEALTYLFKALKIVKNLNYQRGVINIYNNIGLIYSNQGNTTQALDFYQRALSKSLVLGNKRNIAKLYNNLSEVFIATKQYDKAQKYAQKAWLINKQIKVKVLVANTNIILGKIHYQQKQYNQAIVKLKYGVKVAKEMKRPSKVQDGAEVLAKAYHALGQDRKAYEVYQLFKQMTDSLHSESNTQQVTRLASEYEFQKEKDSLQYHQTKERMALNAQLKQEQLSSSFQRNIIALVLGVLVVVSILAFFLYRSQIQQKRLNIELMLQGEELQQNKEEVASQRDILEVKNNELSRYQYRINQSFNAAQIIQHSLLPTSHTLQKFFSDYFVLYKPKDVVSGDFYWLGKCHEQLIVVIADCTGHGVPGAFMTLIASKLLDSIVKINRINQPAEILIALNQEIKQSIGQPQDERQPPIDMLLGMDAVVLNITHQAEDKHFEIGFAGAKNNLIYYDANTGTLGELKGARKSVGGFQNKKSVYQQQQLLLPPQSILYAGSDGLPDQNNGLRKRFGYDHLKKLLAQNVHKPMNEQLTNLDDALQKHMQHNEQRDDILWMGLKL